MSWCCCLTRLCCSPSGYEGTGNINDLLVYTCMRGTGSLGLLGYTYRLLFRTAGCKSCSSVFLPIFTAQSFELMRLNACRLLPLLLIGMLFCHTSTAQLLLRLDHRVGKQSLVLDSTVYRTPAGDSLRISLLQYYISNIELIRSRGEKHIIPKKESFFLVKEQADSTKTIALSAPEGVYSAISFLVGVDSVTSTLGIEERKGVLDPGRDMAAGESMYWTWNSGYIFFKLEGSSPTIPADATGFRQFEFHIGGYGGYNSPTINNIRRVTIHLPAKEPLRISMDQKAVLHLQFDILQVLKAAWTIDLKTQHHIMLTPLSSRIADNYAQGFSYRSVEYQTR